MLLVLGLQDRHYYGIIIELIVLPDGASFGGFRPVMERDFYAHPGIGVNDGPK
jgi:hypothetical protein